MQGGPECPGLLLHRQFGGCKLGRREPGRCAEWAFGSGVLGRCGLQLLWIHGGMNLCPARDSSSRNGSNWEPKVRAWAGTLGPQCQLNYPGIFPSSGARCTWHSFEAARAGTKGGAVQQSRSERHWSPFSKISLVTTGRRWELEREKKRNFFFLVLFPSPLLPALHARA